MENPKYISSLSEYLQAIEALKFHYPNAPLVQNPTSNPFLFRGLSNVSYSLLPLMGVNARTTALLNISR